MKFHRNRLLVFFSILFMICIAWDIRLYFIADKTTIWNYIFNLLYASIYLIGGVVSIFYSVVFNLKSNLGKMLLFLGLGLLSYEGGSLIWFYYNLVQKNAIPYPSWADASFMLFYPFMFMGSFYMLKIFRTLLTKKLIRDALVISIVISLLVFGFFSRPDISAGLPLLEKFINVYYPIGDVVIFSMGLIAIRIGGGKIHPSMYLFASGLILQGIADLLFNYRSSVNIYWNGDVSDLLYLMSGYILSVGIFEVIHSLNQVNSKAVIPAPAVSQNIQPAVSVNTNDNAENGQPQMQNNVTTS